MKSNQYLAFFLALLINNYLQATTLTVNTLTDTASGAGTTGSLRYLMGIAQSGDTINFNSSLSGSIVLNNSLGNLPTITFNNLSIIGQLTTVSGVTIGTPKVAIDGINLPADPDTICFNINNSSTSAVYTISNLSFINFAGNGYSAGISSQQLSGTINISNCFFGTTDGSNTYPNVFGLALVQGSNTATLNLSNSIITASTGAPFQAWGFNEVNVSGCIISGNQQPAIDIQTCNVGSITGNLIGVTTDGLSANPNGNGISLLYCNNFIIGGSIGARNICSGNGNHGIQLMDCSNCTVSYNYLGTNINGTAAIPNIGDGCSIGSDTAGVTYNIVVSNNLISGNYNNGIRLSTDVSPAAITNCTISDNLIGTNLTGTSAIANSFDGIAINEVVSYPPGPAVPNNQGSISNNLVINNLISGNNLTGIRLANNATNNYFRNNKIGTQINGTSSLPNHSHGIFINSYDTACNSNIIGGESGLISGISISYSNIIAYNGGNGINMTPVAANPSVNPPSTAPQTTLNSFLKNSIFSNTSPQIYLASGENNNQATATISQAVLRSYAGTSNAIYLAGTNPNSFDNSNLRIDFFATPASLAATNPQGKIYLGSIDSVAANSSYAQLLTSLPNIDNSYYITSIATAYDNTGAALGDSSQFSSAIIPSYDTAITLGTLTASPNPINLGNSTTLSCAFSGGTAPYTVEWSDGHTVFGVSSSPVTYSPSPTTNTSYYVNITDTLGNSSGNSNTVNVIVGSGPIINSISASPTKVNYGQSSDITTNFTSGIAPYTANWNDYVSGVIVNNLVVSGVTSPYIRGVTPNLTTLYSLQITDSLGLSSPAASVTIPVGPHITSFTASTNPIALGSSTNLNISFTGGTAPFTAAWYANGSVIPGATSTSSITISPTVDTDYYVTITDKNGLSSTSSTITVVVDQGTSIPVLTASPTTIALGSATDLSASFTGGVAPYTALWSDGHTVTGLTNSPATYSPAPLTNTSYSVIIRDALNVNSSSSNTVNIIVDQGPTITNISASPTQVNWGQDSDITVNFTSGIAPYTANWNDYISGVLVNNLVVSGVTSPYLRSVTPELTTLYSLQITDSLNLSSPAASVTIPVGPHITSFTADSSTIGVGQSTNLNVSFTGGTAPFTAVWYANGSVIPGATSTSSITVAPTVNTSYYVTITDSLGLFESSSTIPITVDQGTSTPVLTATPTTIALGSTTDLSASFTGGVAPYTALWSDGHTVTGLTNSPATYSPAPLTNTSYSVIIRDALNANSSSSNTVNIIVDQGPTINNISASPAQVNWGQDSDMTVNFTSGIAPYTANWRDYISGVLVNNLVVSGVTSPYLRSVTPELTTLYSLQITDSLNLSSPAASVTIPVGPHITSFTADSSTIGVGQSTNLNVSFTGGTAPFTAVWYANGSVIPGATSTSSITVAPTVNTSYYVTITDSLGLFESSSTIPITVDQGTSIPVLTATPTTITLGQLAILSATFTSGIAPYNATWSNGESATGVTSPVTITVSPTATTEYTVSITDAYDVSKTSNTVSVTINGSPTISSLTSSPSTIAPNQTATIMLVFDPGSGPCTINWGDGITTDAGTSPAYHNVQASSTTTYTVTITNDYGYSTQDITVTVINPPSNEEFITKLLTKYYGKT